MSQSYTNLVYHIVYSTKERHPWLTDEVRPRLFEYMGGGFRDEGGIALCINGVADHVHILAKLRQDKAVSDVIRATKANASRWIHDTYPALQAFAWQTGYGAFTVSKSQVEIVRAYIANQEVRHRKLDFKEEFVALLKAHGVEFDERYLWD